MKLVRDKVPEIMAAKGLVPQIKIASEPEFVEFLRKKLQEEVIEYVHTPNVEELADILEVLRTLAALHDTTPEQLEAIRKKKADERGGFAKRVILQ